MHFAARSSRSEVATAVGARREVHDHRKGQREGGVAGGLLFFGFRGSRRGLSLGTGSSSGIGSTGTAKADQNIVGLLGRAPAVSGGHQVCG